MPCTAKKYEIKRPDMEAVPGCKDIDISITTRELGEMINVPASTLRRFRMRSLIPSLALPPALGYLRRYRRCHGGSSAYRILYSHGR